MRANSTGPRRLPPDEPTLDVSPAPRRLARPATHHQSPSAPLAASMLAHDVRETPSVPRRLPPPPTPPHDPAVSSPAVVPPAAAQPDTLLAPRTWSVTNGPRTTPAASAAHPSNISATLAGSRYGAAPVGATLAGQSRYRPTEVSVEEVYGPHVSVDMVDDDWPVNPRRPLTMFVRAVTYIAMLVGGAALGVWGYQTYVSDYLAERAQERLERSLPVVGSDLAGGSQSPIVAPDGATPPPPPPGSLTPGTALGTITAPSIGMEFTVVAGVGVAELRTGPGWMETTAFPGQPGNAVLSGHRTTHGAPFRHLDDLVVGDRIELAIPGRPTSVFEVRSLYVVAPTDVWVALPTSGVRLTLTTCHPEGSDTERLVVQAELVEGEHVAEALPFEQWQPSQRVP